MIELPDLRQLRQSELVQVLKDFLSINDLGLPFSSATGANLFIDYVKDHCADDRQFLDRFTVAIELVFEDLERAIRHSQGDIKQQILTLSRAAFVAAELKLAIDTDALAHAVFTVRAICEPDPDLHNAFLLIIRTLGRRTDPNQQIIFWSNLLQFGHRGVRTVAAQNIATADVKSTVLHLPSLLAVDVNSGLVAHSILRAAGSAEQLKAIVDQSDDPSIRELMAAMLMETGEYQAAEIVAKESPVVVPEYLENLRLGDADTTLIADVYVTSPQATRMPRLSEVSRVSEAA